VTINYHLKEFENLSDAERASWSTIHGSNPSLASPYFHPEFTGAVASVREDVRVTVIESAGRAIGFFPFQRGRFGKGRPVGGPLSDFHGVIAEAGAEWSVADLLRASRLSVWSFDHLIENQDGFAAYRASEHRSPTIDVSEGYDAYIAGRRADGSKQILKTEGLGRKLEREVAPMRVELDSRDPAVFEQVLAWKSEQCRETRLPDIFGVLWTRRLLERLFNTRGPDFAGVLSALYVGDELAAAHIGMRSRTVWHYWFPSYDEKYAKFSTGLLLLLRMAQAAPGMGIRLIDLGKGETMYKQRLMSGASTVWEGSIERSSLWTSGRRARRAVEAWSAASVLGKPLVLPLKAWRRIEQSRKFH